VQPKTKCHLRDGRIVTAKLPARTSNFIGLHSARIKGRASVADGSGP
jgi:hypothetical protein